MLHDAPTMLDGWSGEVARIVALTSTRRAFMGGLLKGAFTLGASAAMVSTVFEGSAEATHTYPCGPSPICSGSQGGYMGGSGACPNGKKREYNKFVCTTANVNQCWLAGSWLCCDCCYTNVSNTQPGHTRKRCTSCGSTTHYGCINVFKCC